MYKMITLKLRYIFKILYLTEKYSKYCDTCQNLYKSVIDIK